MAVTKYQVLHRYMNEGTNTAITNDMSSDYEEVMEFYTDPDHMIFSEDDISKATALDEQQKIISYGNSGENPKANMIFAYDGTKKIKHKKWVEESIGYVVKDWNELSRSSIGNKGDFSKPFTTLNASTPENGGDVVCTESIFKQYFTGTITVVNNNSLADAGTSANPYYTTSKMEELIDNATIFALNTSNWEDHVSPSIVKRGNIATLYTGPVAINGNDMIRYDKYCYSIVNSYTRLYHTGMASTAEEYLYEKVTITLDQIKTTTIPGHYEDVNTYPYLIKDTYKRIQLSPWFVNCTVGSLESALTKAKKLVDMIGLDNVKVIKIVPFDQMIKIK